MISPVLANSVDVCFTMSSHVPFFTILQASRHWPNSQHTSTHIIQASPLNVTVNPVVETIGSQWWPGTSLTAALFTTRAVWGKGHRKTSICHRDELPRAERMFAGRYRWSESCALDSWCWKVAPIKTCSIAFNSVVVIIYIYIYVYIYIYTYIFISCNHAALWRPQ